METGIIQLTQYIPHPPEMVWAALTDPELHAKWWAAGDIRAELGHQFTLDMRQWGKQTCEVLAVESKRLFSYSFAPGSLNTTITWQLEAEGAGTRIYLEHKGFDLESSVGLAAFQGMRSGWPTVIARIESTLF